MTSNRPDRPIPAVLSPLRYLVRAFRIFVLKIRLGRRMKVGRNVFVARGATILPPTRFHLGDDVAIGMNFHLEADLQTGSEILISSNVSIIGNDHRFDVAESVFWAGRLTPPLVVIEGDNLIGFGTTIIGPVTIGRGTIVGAGSLVTRSLPPESICVGRPAVPIRKRVRSGERSQQ